MAYKSDEYSSLDSITEVTGFLAEQSRYLVNHFTDIKKKVWKNKDLNSMVELYFESTANTLNLFNTVEDCVKRAETSQRIIRFAVKHFETETDLGGNINDKKKNKYAKTLEELNKFEAMGDSFGEDFATQYECVYKQQVFLLEELCRLKVKLAKKHKKLKIFSNVVLATALAPVIFVSMLGAPLLAAPFALALLPFKYQKTAKKRKQLGSLIEKRATINSESTKTINSLVENLSDRIKWILKTAGVAVENEEELSTKSAMRTIMKKVDGFTEKIVEVGDNVANHSKWIVEGRKEVKQYLAKVKGRS